MFTIYTNVSITRRKSYFMVCDHDDIVVFKHRHFWPCIEYLDAEAIEEYTIRPAEHDEAVGAELLVHTRRP